MARLAVLTVFALAISCFAQVTVTNGGYATSSGPMYPAAPSSPPILYTPIVQLGQGQTQPIQTNAGTNSIFTPADENIPEAPLSLQVAPTVSNAKPKDNPFNFGAAQFETSAGVGSVGQDINGKSLADVAREQRQHRATSARSISNTDIEKLSQGGSKPAINPNDRWLPNNGVINPAGPENPSAVPDQQNQANPSKAPTTGPKAELDGGGEPILMAQNDPAHEPLAQQGQSSGSNTESTNQERLPQTASKLPMVGLAGLFSVSMGIFVRYQRAKSR